MRESLKQKIMTHKLDYFEKAVKIKNLLEQE